jgi:hypothetical protein
MAASCATSGPLLELNGHQLAMADQRYPKWATLCRHRLLGLPVLNAALITPEVNRSEIMAIIGDFADAIGEQRIMLRSDGGTETRKYYRGGNTFPLHMLEERVSALLNQGRASILLEPTNRFANHLTVMFRLERPVPASPGQFTVEALGPGYDVADLTRGGVSPQITVTAAHVDWARYRELWWSDLRLSSNRSPEAESMRKQQHLRRLATHILTDMGHMASGLPESDLVAIAEAWLRDHGYLDLWQNQDIETVVARHALEWFDDAFLIAMYHPNKSWTCLATAVSNLGMGRWVFWDVVDGARKYGTRTGRVT